MKRTAWLAAWPVLAVFVLSNAPTPVYVLWQRELGFSAGVLTVVFACYIAGLLAALLVAGVLSDRIGRKPVLLPALALGIMACVLFATAGSVLVLAVARFLTGLAVGAAVSAGMAAVNDVAPGEGKTAALASSTAMVLGAGLGPLLAGVASETLPGPTVTIFLAEIVLLVSAGIVVARLPLPRPVGTTRAWIRIPQVHPAGRSAVLCGVAVFAPGITATSFVLSLGPSVLTELLDTTNRIVAGALAFVMFLGATGVQFAVRGLPVRAILLAGAASTTAGMVALVVSLQTASPALLAVAAVLAGTGQGMGQFGGLTLINASVPANRLAEATAAQNVGGYVPAAVLPLAAGFLSDAAGLATGATAFGAVVIAAALAGGLVAGRGRPARQVAASTGLRNCAEYSR